VDDVVVNKSATIERCLARVREEYGDGSGLESDLRRQDALVLNLLRACETAIDLAMHAVRKASLGVPQSSRDAFALLARVPHGCGCGAPRSGHEEDRRVRRACHARPAATNARPTPQMAGSTKNASPRQDARPQTDTQRGQRRESAGRRSAARLVIA